MFTGVGVPEPHVYEHMRMVVQQITPSFSPNTIPILTEFRPMLGNGCPMSESEYNEFQRLFEHYPIEQLNVMPVMAIRNAIPLSHPNGAMWQGVLGAVLDSALSLFGAMEPCHDRMYALALRCALQRWPYTDYHAMVHSAIQTGGWRIVRWYMLEDNTLFAYSTNSAPAVKTDQLQAVLRGRPMQLDHHLTQRYTDYNLTPFLALTKLGV